MTIWRCALPLPPSVNALFRNVAGRGRVKTKAYLAWIEEAGWLLQKQKPRLFRGPVGISIQVPTDDRADIDNRQKGLLDLLVGHSVIEDDSKVWDLRIRRAFLKSPRTCVVEICSI